MSTENITRHDSTELAEAMDTIAVFVAKDGWDVTFSLDLHPDGLFRAVCSSNSFRVAQMRHTAENAIIDLADELTERFGKY